MKNDVKDNNHCWLEIQLNKYILLVMSILLLSLLQAQQGQYDRKSVSSLGMIWYNGELKVVDENYKNLINSYIEVPRFDYNNLPKRIVSHFYEKSKNINDIIAIESLLEETVIQEVVKILNDPDIQINRGLALKDESAFQSFAATKAKSLGITTEELTTLMNSAYIYLPFVTYSNSSRLLLIPLVYERVKYEVKGGIIWWNVRTDADGKPSIQKVTTYDARGLAGSNIGLIKLFSLWTGGLYEYDREKIDADIYQSATMAFVRSLSTKSKEIEEFNLSAQIVEADGKKYKMSLGKKEGIRLDDGFHIVEFYEKEDGELKIKKKGFSRIVKTGNNIDDARNLSIVRQSIGKKVSEGSILMEHPRSNVVIELQYGQSSINIPKTIFSHITQYNFNNAEIFNEDVTSAKNLSLNISYNISSVVNSTQTFLKFNFGSLEVDKSKLNQSIVDSSFFITSPYFYTGFTKKFGFGRSNLGFGLALGFDQISMSGDMYVETGLDIPKPGHYEFLYNKTYFGSKLSTEYELLLTPDISFNVEINTKMTGGGGLPDSIGLKDYEYLADDGSSPLVWELDAGEEDDWPTIIDGVTFNVGFTYAPKTLPFNWGGWLDKRRKY